LTLNTCDASGLRAPGVSFVKARFESTYLAEARLAGCDFSDAQLREMIAPRATFAKARLAGANMERALLSGANLAGVDASGAVLSGAILEETHAPQAVFARAIMVAAYARRADLSRCDFTGARAGLMTFNRATVAGSRFVACELGFASFGFADLRRTVFSEVDAKFGIFVGAEFGGAMAERVDFLAADFYWSNMGQMVMKECDLESARRPEPVQIHFGPGVPPPAVAPRPLYVPAATDAELKRLLASGV
jgi:uncharacterized protein YjbI with pentapeptide repeats